MNDATRRLRQLMNRGTAFADNETPASGLNEERTSPTRPSMMRITDGGGRYWTGECWGDVRAAEEYASVEEMPDEIDDMSLDADHAAYYRDGDDVSRAWAEKVRRDPAREHRGRCVVKPGSARVTLNEWVGNAYASKPPAGKAPEQDYRKFPGSLAALVYGQTRTFLDGVITGLEGAGKFTLQPDDPAEDATPRWPAPGDARRELKFEAEIAGAAVEGHLVIRLEGLAGGDSAKGFCCCPASDIHADGDEFSRRQSVGEVWISYSHPRLGDVNRSLKFDALATPQDVSGAIRETLLAPPVSAPVAPPPQERPTA